MFRSRVTVELNCANRCTSVVLSRECGEGFPPRSIWQCLEMFFIVMTWEGLWGVLLASGG